MKKEQRLRVAEHEEEVHMMCEPEQDGYLDKEKEDADTEFADKLMNMAKNSYQCEMEEGNVEERSFEDLKDCFAETEQHGMLEEKVLVEVEEPFEFDANGLCLNTS